MPVGPSRRIGWTRPSQSLKSPTTLTRSALGAQTAKCTPSAVADPHQVRAELVVDPGVLALREEIDVVFGDDPAVAIRIVDLRGRARRDR